MFKWIKITSLICLFAVLITFPKFMIISLLQSYSLLERPQLDFSFIYLYARSVPSTELFIFELEAAFQDSSFCEVEKKDLSMRSTPP